MHLYPDILLIIFIKTAYSPNPETGSCRIKNKKFRQKSGFFFRLQVSLFYPSRHREFHSSKHARHDASAQTLHQFSSFNVLFQKPVYFLNRPSAAARDPFPPASIQDLVMTPFPGSHGAYNGFDMNQLFFIDINLVKPAKRPHIRQHPEDLVQRAHLPYLLQLISKIIERNFT